MNTRTLILSAAIVVAASSILHADIIGFNTNGELTTPNCSVQWSPGESTDPSKLTISASGTDTSANVAGDILLDHLGDPTIDIENIVYNHSASTWTSYLATILMNQAFTIQDPYITQPGDWSFGVTQPTYNAALGDYIGYVQLNAGTSIPSLDGHQDGNKLDFGYTMSFEGTQPPTFGQTLSAVPEPGTIATLIGAAVAAIPLVVRRMRRGCAVAA